MVWQFRSASEVAPRGEEARRGSRAIPDEPPVPFFGLVSGPSAESAPCSTRGPASTDLPARRAHSYLWAFVHAPACVWNAFLTRPDSEGPPGSHSHREGFPDYSDPFAPLMSFILPLPWLLMPRKSPT